MHTTPVSLLERLRRPEEQEAWGRCVELYTPLIYYWARRAGSSVPEAADLAQDVFVVLIQKLPEFRYDRGGTFRGWLRTITLNKWRELHRRRVLPARRDDDPRLEELVVPDPTESFDEAEYRNQLVGRALRLMQAEFQPTTWKACWEHVVSGRPAADVARELAISVDSVYAAKSRVLRRLRTELDGLID
ncbi:sigma-70 family RNA polymerase sigma factor [Singulisphaera sp. Ch08]|uniref:Sigma-70 family RNA polymerase sigma factor n=1 Tax=Singulisphaera sp. Ch08 TaxID=3120278 RepID=A0AAU7CIL5_9BACT